MTLRLDIDTRKKLLEHISRLRVDADPQAGDLDLARVFLPLPRHALALRPDVVVLAGSRGAGKTALFNLITLLGRRVPDFFNDQAIPAAYWVAAFAESPEHPQPAVLDQVVARINSSSDDPLRTFWAVHLLARLADASVPGATMPPPLAAAVRAAPGDPGAWLDKAQVHLAAVIAALDVVDRTLEKSSTYLFASYDHLDRLGALTATRNARQRLVRSLLALWLSLSSRYRRLRAKIFLRPDLLEEAERAFPDASKLRARSVSLEWDVSALYMLAVRHLANQGPDIEVMVDWIREKARLDLERHSASSKFGLLPPTMGEDEQWTFATALAGEQMGSGPKKGYTYRWIPQRLKDGSGSIVPRSLLRLLGVAAKQSLRYPRGRGPLISTEDLVGALVETSRARVTELGDEYPVVKRLENLSSQTMLMERDDVIALLANRTAADDPFGTDGELIFQELHRIGVLETRADGRVDVPDIYRYGYNIKRKGGARAPR
ncbi:MAG TPA: hypothetical protein VHE35_26955 [Kofleriaceae bacterium]|nr:hypothetical protein [Kofleriaceae bacterium]